MITSVAAPDGRWADVERWAWRLAPVAAGLVALALNLVTLGRKSLWIDEAQTVDLVTQSWSELWRDVQAFEAPHGMYYAASKLWLSVAGTSEWAVRFPSAAAGALAVALTCVLGSRLFGRWAGLVAAGALATSVYVLIWSQQGRGYSLALAAAALATLAFVSALEHRSGRWWALWALTVALALAVNLFVVAIVASHAVAFAVRRPLPSLRAPFVALGAVGAAAVGLAAFVRRADAGQLDWLDRPTLETVGSGVWQLGGANPFVLAVAIVGAIGLATGAVRGSAPWKPALLVAWLAAPFVLTLGLSVVQPAFHTRYLVSAAPAVALLVAAGVVAQRRWVALALVVLLGASSGFRLVQWYAGPATEDWRAAVRAVRSEQQAGEAVIAVPDYQRVSLEYYAGSGFGASEPSGERVWLLVASPDADERLRLARGVVDPPQYALLEERQYGERLWLQVWQTP